MKLYTLFFLLLTLSSANLLAQNSILLDASSSITNTHSTVSEKLIDITKGLDNLFGDENGKYPPPKTQATIMYTTTSITNSKTVSETKIRLKLALPRTQKKFHLIVKNLNDEVNSSELFNPNRQTKNDNSYSTSLRYFLIHNDTISIHSDAGVLLKDPLDLFVKIRSEQHIDFNPWKLKLDEQIAYYESSGYSLNIGANFTRYLASNYWLKQSNLTSWKEENKYFQFFNELDFIYDLKKHRSITYFIRSLGQDKPTVNMLSYDYGVSFKTRVGWDWLSLSFSPYLNHQREFDFKSNSAVSFNLEILLGAT